MACVCGRMRAFLLVFMKPEIFDLDTFADITRLPLQLYPPRVHRQRPSRLCCSVSTPFFQFSYGQSSNAEDNIGLLPVGTLRSAYYTFRASRFPAAVSARAVSQQRQRPRLPEGPFLGNSRSRRSPNRATLNNLR